MKEGAVAGVYLGAPFGGLALVVMIGFADKGPGAVGVLKIQLILAVLGRDSGAAVLQIDFFVVRLGAAEGEELLEGDGGGVDDACGVVHGD